MWDIIDLHGVSQASFFKVLWCTVEAINTMYDLPGLPLDDNRRLLELSEGFHSLNKYTLPGCVGAIDGIGIEIFKPSCWDTIYPAQFKNRKGFWSINCQAICDSKLRFLWTSLKSPGGTHDSLAWQSTDLHGKLTQHGLPEGYYLVGDDAYAARSWMVTPFPSTGLTREKSDFNFYQSRTRITIERSFGVLCSRFGLLRRPMSCNIQHNVAAVRCCMRIHNMCIDDSVPEVEPIHVQLQHVTESDWSRGQKDCFRPPRQSEGLAFPLNAKQRKEKSRIVDKSQRNNLMQHIMLLGLRRPATSRHGLDMMNAYKRNKRIKLS